MKTKLVLVLILVLFLAGCASTLRSTGQFGLAQQEGWTAVEQLVAQAYNRDFITKDQFVKFLEIDKKVIAAQKIFQASWRAAYDANTGFEAVIQSKADLFTKIAQGLLVVQDLSLKVDNTIVRQLVEGK